MSLAVGAAAIACGLILVEAANVALGLWSGTGFSSGSIGGWRRRAWLCSYAAPGCWILAAISLAGAVLLRAPHLREFRGAAEVAALACASAAMLADLALAHYAHRRLGLAPRVPVLLHFSMGYGAFRSALRARVGTEKVK